jgi:hypothetical protein
MKRSSLPEYESYKGMKKRCYNPNSQDYYNYGGRGIVVCDEWLGKDGFDKFLNDLGFRPSSKHSIDRINSNGNYCKENCRWATISEQSKNKNRNWVILINDKWIEAKEAAKIFNVSYFSLVNGMNGWQALPKNYRNITFVRKHQLNNF